MEKQTQGDFDPGDCIRLSGLVSRPELNGRTGEVLRFVPHRSRYEVRLDSSPVEDKPMGLRKENLERSTPQEAVEALTHQLREHPQDASIHCSLGIQLHILGDFAGAATALQAAIELCPDHKEASHFLAAVRDRLGDHDGAIAICKEVVKKWPKDARMQYRLACLLRSQGDLQGSQQACRDAITAEVKSATSAWVLLAVLLSAQGQRGAALTELRQALQAVEPRAESYCLIANAMDQHGDMDGALAAFRAALREDAEHKQAKAGLDALIFRNRKE